MKPTIVVAFSLALGACGGSGSSPTSPGAPRVLQGQTVSAIDGRALGVVDIQLGDRPMTPTDADGNFQIDVDGPGSFTTTVSGSPVVERHTSITGPSAGRMKLALIPTTFPLDAFNEMFRGTHDRLQRWKTPPALVVLGTVMKFSVNNTDHYEAGTEQLTDAEVTALVSDLKDGLALLSGGTYSTFASVDVEHPRAGEMVNVEREGRIVVGRYKGVSTDGQTIGYGTWAEESDGTIVGGTMWLDRDFDRDDARRRLVRVHELGHALGYNHVTVRPSIMNPAVGPEPTDFDRDGSKIAFQRPVGNRAPDTDFAVSAGGGTAAVGEGTVRWSAPIR
jgi:hypothetical protein